MNWRLWKDVCIDLSEAGLTNYGLHILVRVMVEQKLAEALERLDLSAQDPFNEEHVITLPAFHPKIRQFPKLLYLDLSHNRLAAQGAALLFKSMSLSLFPVLRQLALAHNHIDDEPMPFLTLPPTLEKLDLSFNRLTVQGLKGGFMCQDTLTIP